MTPEAAVPDPTPPSVSDRAPVGSVLRAARLKRGVTVESVADRTRIPKRYVTALEEDRFDEFPAPVYLRGFLKSYCDFLEIAFEPLWASVAPPAPAPVAADAKAAASSAPSESRPVASVSGAWVFAGVFLVVGAVWLLRPHASSPAAAPRPAVAPAPAAAEPGAVSGADSGMARPDAARPDAAPQAEPKRVVVEAVDDVQTKVDVDGETVFEGRIPKGARMDWTPSKSMALTVSDASLVRVTVDGVERGLGAAGPGGRYRISLR